MCLIRLRLFTIEQDVTAIWGGASVPRRLNVPHFEVRVCLPLRGNSSLDAFISTIRTLWRPRRDFRIGKLKLTVAITVYLSIVET